MAKEIFANSNSKKKKKDEDELFYRVASYARQKALMESRGEKPLASTKEPVGKTPTKPTVSSTVGSHTSDYGKYSGSNVGKTSEEEPEKKWYEKLVDQDEHINFVGTLLNYDEWLPELWEAQTNPETWKNAAEGFKNDVSSAIDAGKNVFMTGITGTARRTASTLDTIAPTEFLGKYDPFSWLSDGTKKDNDYWRERLATSLEGKGKVAQVASDVGVGVVEALPQALAAIFSSGTSLMGQANTLAPHVASATSWLGTTLQSAKTVVGNLLKNPSYYMSAVQTLGTDYEEAKADGASDAQAAVSAIISTGLNAAIEVSGGIETLPKALREADGKTIRKWIMSMPEEGIEEVLQRFTSGTVQKAVYDHDKKILAWNDEDAIISAVPMAKEFLMGTAVGGILSGGQTVGFSVYNSINNNRLAKIGKDYVDVKTDLIAEGLSFGEGYEAYKVAKELQAKAERGEEISDVDLGRLVLANEQSKRTDLRNAPVDTSTPSASPAVETSVEAPVQSRMQTISARLAEGGMETAQAEVVAQSIDRILSGDTSVTGKDKDVLSVGNNAARAIFEEETGVKLPNTNASTRKAISEYIAQTAMSQQKQEAAVHNVMEAWQNQKTQEETARQLKDNMAANPVANAASETLRQAAHQAVVTAQTKTDMDTLGEHGKTAYQKHIANAANAVTFSNAFQRYYDAGQIGVPFESIKTAYDGNIPRAVLYEAYAAGQNDAPAVVKDNPSSKKKVDKKGKKTPSKGKGRFYDSRTHEGKAASDGKTVTKAVIKALEQFAKVFNIDIELVDSIDSETQKSAANGRYVASERKIYLAADSWNPLMTVLKHEVTHHIQRTNPAQYKAFKDYVMKAFYNNSQEDMNAEIQRRIDLAKLNGSTLTRSEAMDEIVADATESFLTDRDSIDALVKENRSLGETILNAIRDVLRKIEAAMKGEKIGTGSWWLEADQLKQAEKMWVEALASASHSEIGVNDVVISESSAPIWSLKSMKFDLLDGQMQRDLVEHGILTVEETNHLMAEISKLIDKMSPFAHIVDMNEEYSKDNRPFAVYKPNSDPLYKVSLDFSTLCKKRLMTQFVMESLQTKLGKALSAKEQMAIRSKLEEYGKVNEQIQVACALCYVEARRLKAPDQINRFLDDRTTILTDYFGKKNKEYKQKVEDMASKMKVRLGYKADTKLKDMKPSDKKKVNEAKQKMMKEYTPTAEEQEIIARANALDNAEFLSQDGLTRLNINEPAIYDAFVSHVRNATKSKALEGGVPYYYGDSKSVSDSLIEAMNAENGLRHQSWSDFEVIHLLDTIAAVIDLSVRKAKVQSYTKVPAFVHVNGNTGMMINLSLIPAGKNGMKDGKLDFSPTEGMDYAVAVELRNQYHKTTGTIAIGIDDKQIGMLLDDPTIDYVIPYHTSGMNAQLRKMAGIAGWLDYESYQSEKEIKGAKQGDCPDALWHKKPDFSEWFDTSKLDMSKSGVEIMREAAGRYLVMCEERGLAPKFSNTKQHTDFSKHENYWKLLIDRKMVDGDGNIIIQQAVRPNFDFNKISEVVDTDVKNYDPTLLDSINEMIMNEWENGGIKQREAELLKEEKAKKKAEKKAAKVQNGLLEQAVAPEKAQKNTTDGGVQYSYESLVKKDPIKVVTVKERPVPIVGKKVDRGAVSAIAFADATVQTDAKTGVSQRFVRIPDINSNVLLNKRGVEHGMLGNKTNGGTVATAEVTGDLVEILKNSIAVNERNPRTEKDGDFSYILFGYAKNENGQEYIVKSTVNHFPESKSIIDSVEIYDVLKGSKAKKMESELMRSYSADAAAVHANGSDSNYTISVAELLEVVKDNYPELLSKDVLAHYNISEDVQESDMKFSLKDSTGRTLSKGQQEYFKDSKVRDENGNLMVMYHGTNTPNFTVFDPSFSDDGISLFFTSSPNVADSYTSVQHGGMNLNPYRLPHTIKTMDEYNQYMEDIGSETRIVYVTDEVIEKARRDVDDLIKKDKRSVYLANRIDELEKIKGKYIHHNGGVNYITRSDAIYDTAEELIQEDTNDKYWTPYRFGSRYSVYLNMRKPYILDTGKKHKAIAEMEIEIGFESTTAMFTINGEDFVINKGYKESYEDFARSFLSEKDADKFLRKVEEKREKFIREEMEIDGKTREEVISFWEKHGGVEVEPFTYKVKNASIDYTESGVWKNLEWEGRTGTTRDLAKWAKDNKYDGVILKNLKDIGGYSGGTVTEAATVAIAFDSNQVKATSNLNPTADPDIRYSLKDSSGKALTEGQQEFFKDSKTRDAEGRLLRLYHGSKSQLFTEFDMYQGVWLTPDQRYAEVYADQWHSWRDDFDVDRPMMLDEADIYADPDYRLYEVYANITKPLDIGEINEPLEAKDVRRIASALGVNVSDLKAIADDYMDQFIYEMTRSPEFIELARKQHFDGFKATEKGRETWCAIQSADQVKKVDNTDPTSDPDIRYQLKTPPELLEISKQIAEEQHKAKAVTDADIMSKAIKDLNLTGVERDIVKNYQDAMKKLADYEKELAVYDATKGEHPKGRSIYTDASGKVKKSGVKYSAEEKAKIQQKVNWWRNRLKEIEQKEAFQKVLKREKAKMAETHAKKMSDLRDAYNKRLTALRDQRDAKVEAEKQKMRDYKQHQRDSKAYKELKAKLEADVKWLGDRLVHPTDSKHIPEDFKKVVATFLESLDFTTKGMDKNIAKTGNPSKKYITMWSMIEEYQKIAKDNSSGIELTPIEEAMHKTLIETFEGGRRLEDLDYDELNMVYDMIRWIKAGVANANKTFNENIKETISEMGDDAIFELGIKKAKKEHTGLVAEADKLLFSDNITPGDMFHRFGGTLEKLYKEIRKGFNKHIENVRTAIDEVHKLTNGHEEEIKEWSNASKVYQIADGTIELTQAQVMSLYALMKRDQARTHIVGNEETLGYGIVPSGVVIEESRTISDFVNKENNRNVKGDKEMDKKKLSDLTVKASRKIDEYRKRVTPEDVAKIIGDLNEEQKRIADGIVKLFTTKCADWGNETSMKLFNMKKFVEKNYFPIKSSDAFLQERFDDGGDVLIKNISATKNTVANANNPIVVDDIFNVLTDHVNKMSMYNALVVPLTDFTKVYNYQHRDEFGDIVSVKDALTKAHGMQAAAYVTQFMKDVNKQANTIAAESLANKALTTFKKAKVGANLRVLVQQPTAIVRAADMVDPKYILAGLKQKANYEELFENSEIAYWKSLGFFETDTARSMKDILMGNEKWLDKATMDMYGKADDFAWGHLWNAIKLEQADAHPDMDTTSSEFMDLVKARFEAVVDRTQVVDSVFHRSQLMRNKSVFTKMLTAFMSEPTKTYNMLVTDISDAINTGDKKAKSKIITRSVGTFVASQIVTSMFSAIIDALRDDEDEDKEGNKRSGFRKYVEAVGKNIVDNIIPMNLVPYLRDVVSVFSGYDVKRTDMDTLSKFVKVAQKWLSGKHSYTYLIKETAASFAEIFGIPVQNALRDLDAIVRSTANLFGGLGYAEYWLEKRRYDITHPDNRSKFYKHYTTAVLAGNEKAADAILVDMAMNGIPYDNIIAKGYQAEKKVAFTKARKLISKGKTDEAKGIVRELAKKYDKKFSTLWKSVKEEEPEETYDFKDLKRAFRRGEDTDEIEDYLVESGEFSKEAMREAIKMLTEKYK